MLTHNRFPIPCFLICLFFALFLTCILLNRSANAAESEQAFHSDSMTDSEIANPDIDYTNTANPENTSPDVGNTNTSDSNDAAIANANLSSFVSGDDSGNSTDEQGTEQHESEADNSVNSVIADSLSADNVIRTDESISGKQISLHVYLNFYDSSSNDIDHTIGLYSMEVMGTIIGDYIEGAVNPYPGMFDYQELEDFPQVLINYGDISGREKNISEECSYDSDTGMIRIPSKYADEYLTVKCIMSEKSRAYQMFVPDTYKVIKTSAPMLRAPATDTSQFEVLENSGNYITVIGDTSKYKTGDVITVTEGYIQTLNKNEDSSLYTQTGTSAYMGYKGEAIGYAISFSCSSDPIFSNIGTSGGSRTSRFPTSYNSYVTIPFSNRNWIYARCITTDSNLFDGNPMFSSGKITITDKAADGTLTCWVELYLTGPKNENAQNVGMYFKLKPTDLQSLTITKYKYMTLTKLTGARFSLWSYDGSSYSKQLGYFTDNQDGSYTFNNINVNDSYEQRFLIKEEEAPPGYTIPYHQGFASDRTDYETYGGRTVQFVDGTWVGTFSTFQKFQNKQKPNVNLTIRKQIYKQDVYWAHGTPTFFFHITGTDEFGKSHAWIRCMIFTPEYVSYNTNSDNTIIQSVTLKNIPPGNYTIKELPVSRFALTNVVAETENVRAYKINRLHKYEGITPVRGYAVAHLSDSDGTVTFVNRKITWDKYNHNNVVINEFSLAT